MLAGEQVVIIEGGEQNRKLTKVTSAASKALFSPSDPTHLMVPSTGPPTWPDNNVEMSCFLTPPIPVPWVDGTWRRNGQHQFKGIRESWGGIIPLLLLQRPLSPSSFFSMLFHLLPLPSSLLYPPFHAAHSYFPYPQVLQFGLHLLPAKSSFLMIHLIGESDDSST